MSTTTLEIRPDLKMQLDHLAEERHRSAASFFRMRKWKRSLRATLNHH